MRFIEPALPHSDATPPVGREWLHEIKFDGWRAQVHVDAGQAVIFTRNGNDTTDSFANLAAALGSISARSAIIDAELVAVDRHGRCDFRALHRRKPEAVCLRAFDLLEINGRDVQSMPLVVRRARLQRLVAKSAVPCLLFSDAFADPSALLEAAERFGLEGIVSKRKAAPYTSGDRSGWVKVKTVAWREANRERWRMFEPGEEPGPVRRVKAALLR